VQLAGAERFLVPLRVHLAGGYMLIRGLNEHGGRRKILARFDHHFGLVAPAFALLTHQARNGSRLARGAYKAPCNLNRPGHDQSADGARGENDMRAKLPLLSVSCRAMK
jgi:hypothetical protein